MCVAFNGEQSRQGEGRCLEQRWELGVMGERVCVVAMRAWYGM